MFVFTEMIKASVTRTSAFCRFGINAVEIIQHGCDRGVQAVEVQTVKTDFRLMGSKIVVIGSQPTNEIQDIGIAPHPGWKTSES